MIAGMIRGVEKVDIHLLPSFLPVFPAIFFEKCG